MPKSTEWSDDEIRIIMDVVHTRHGTRHRCDRPQFGERKGCGGYHLAVGSNLASRTAGRVWQKAKSWGAVDTYLGFSPTTRIIFAVMFVVGVVLCVSLWLTDLGIGFTRPSWVTRYGAEWLHSHGYIPNILAGFTGFLIGVPVAAIILTSFYSQREEKIAVDRVNRLSKSAWYTFRDAVYEFCSEERITALEHDMPLIDGFHDNAFKALQEYIRVMQTTPPPANLDDLLVERADVIRHNVFDTSQELANRMRVDPEWASTAWAGVVGAWNILDQYVRLQRLEVNLDWFDNRPDAMIRKWISLPQNPFLAFVDLHGFYPRRPDPELRAGTMMDAAHAIHTYSRMSDSELRTFLGENSDVFGYMRVLGYKDSYEYALKFMNGLRSAVDHVELAYWPEIATTPSKEVRQKFELSAPRLLGSVQTPDGQKIFMAELERVKAKMDAEKAATVKQEQSDLGA